MSGIKPQPLTEFYRSLHARGESTDSLARQLGVSGAKLRKLIGLLQRRSGLAWKGLLSRLTERERALLLSVEQCSSWNNRQRAMRPSWDLRKVIDLAECYPQFEKAKDRLRRVSA